MTLRFRRSIKLAPGVRWNLSASGSSWTFGPRGASINVGRQGTYLNSGIPGTGLYSRSRLVGGGPVPRARPTTTTVSMQCGVRDDGVLYFVDHSGQPVAEHLVDVAKKQNKEAILGLIQRKCDEINDEIESLGRLHHDTPDPSKRPQFVAPQFDRSEPAPPNERRSGFFEGLFRRGRERVAAENRDALEAYRVDHQEWAREKAAFDRTQARQHHTAETLLLSDVAVMDCALEAAFQKIAWPRETEVAFDIREQGRKMLLNVDLPEIEHMPTQQAAMPGRGLKLSVKALPAAKVRRLYLDHVHGIIFRLIGETFAALPTVTTIVASGYSQRRSPATGQLLDEYLLSVRVRRDEWQVMDFDHLQAIDVVDALARYELRRETSKTAGLKAINRFED